MPPSNDAGTKLLDAAVAMIRGKGFAATSVDGLCRQAGVTKGDFFHHVRCNEDPGVATATYFGDTASGLFSTACSLLFEPQPREEALP